MELVKKIICFQDQAVIFSLKPTAIVATLFIICSLCLTILSNKELEPEKSILDKIEQNTDSDAPKIPQNN